MALHFLVINSQQIVSKPFNKIGAELGVSKGTMPTQARKKVNVSSQARDAVFA